MTSRGRSTGLQWLLARRYLRSTRRDAFISFLSLTAAGGLAIGVAALILALAALTGFQSALRREILARTPALEVSLPAGADAAALRRAVGDLEGVTAAQLVVRGQGWLVSEGRVRAVELTGFEGRLPPSFPEATERGEGLYVGERLIEAWNLVPGEVMEVASSRPTLTPLGPQPRVRRLQLAGSYATGRTELVERVALPLAAAEDLLGSRRLAIEVSCTDLDRALELAPVVSGLAPPGSELRTWQELNRGLFFALRLEKSLMFVAVFLIVAVAALALVSDLSLIIASKRREIGILGAMGLAPPAVERTFALVGGLLAAGGVGLGATVGLGGAWLLDRYRLLRIPGGVYFLDHVPFEVRGLDLALVLGATVALALLGARWASRAAAALRPVEALRR